jgi:hypothetical protein
VELDVLVTKIRKKLSEISTENYLEKEIQTKKKGING